MSEESLHRTVVQYLHLAMPEEVYWYHPANGGYKVGKRTAGRLKMMGVRAGVPDICLVHRGSAIFIELKAPGALAGTTVKGRGYLSPEQRDCHHALRMAGAIVATCRTLEEVQNTLRNWGVVERRDVAIGGLFAERGATAA